MENFRKEVTIGQMKDDRRYWLHIEIEYKNKRLSITGEESSKNKRFWRSGGQITLEPGNIDFAQGWNRKKVERLAAIWNKWHLNDLHAECEHQRVNWNLDEKIEVIDFTWSKKFNDMRRRAEAGLMDENEYAEYKQIIPDVFETTINTTKHHWLSPMVCGLLYLDLIKIDKRETKSAHWVRYNEHPQGLLCKPCEVCGYEYGTKWHIVEVPKTILQELLGM